MTKRHTAWSHHYDCTFEFRDFWKYCGTSLRTPRTQNQACRALTYFHGRECFIFWSTFKSSLYKILLISAITKIMMVQESPLLNKSHENPEVNRSQSILGVFSMTCWTEVYCLYQTCIVHDTYVQLFLESFLGGKVFQCVYVCVCLSYLKIHQYSHFI